MIVHVLHEGFALCRTVDGFPGEWPLGHLWTYPHEREKVTCQKCLEVLDSMTDEQGCAKKVGKNRPGCG